MKTLVQWFFGVVLIATAGTALAQDDQQLNATDEVCAEMCSGGDNLECFSCILEEAGSVALAEFLSVIKELRSKQQCKLDYDASAADEEISSDDESSLEEDDASHSVEKRQTSPRGRGRGRMRGRMRSRMSPRRMRGRMRSRMSPRRMRGRMRSPGRRMRGRSQMRAMQSSRRRGRPGRGSRRGRRSVLDLAVVGMKLDNIDHNQFKLLDKVVKKVETPFAEVLDKIPAIEDVIDGSVFDIQCQMIDVFKGILGKCREQCINIEFCSTDWKPCIQCLMF